MNKQLSKDEVLAMFNVGFEFEHFSKFKEKDLVKSLKETLGKKITVPRALVGLNKKVMVVHNHDITPTDQMFKLEKDYSGGPDMWELITGPMTYQEARLILIKFYQWLQKYGGTNDRCSNHMNISIDKKRNKLRADILNMDRLKYCLAFDENFVYERYPKRKDNVYAQSMKIIYPNNKFSFNDDVKLVSYNSYKVPNTKYYGVNFIKQASNYLEFRYCGGTDYEYKLNEALECLDHYCLSIYNVLTNPDYDSNDISQLNSILSKQKKNVASFSSLEDFVLAFPNIKIMVDLQGDQQILKTRWNELKEILYDLIILCKMTKGYINYDSIVGKYQIKDAVIKDCNSMNSYEFVNSEVDGLFYNCDFYHCSIKNSQLTDCDIIKGNLIENSKILNSPIKYSNKSINCYIDNKDVLVNGNIEKSIIRNGNISQIAVIDDKTLII